jgi:hypothetical protein
MIGVIKYSPTHIQSALESTVKSELTAAVGVYSQFHDFLIDNDENMIGILIVNESN